MYIFGDCRIMLHDSDKWPLSLTVKGQFTQITKRHFSQWCPARQKLLVLRYLHLTHWPRLMDFLFMMLSVKYWHLKNLIATDLSLKKNYILVTLDNPQSMLEVLKVFTGTTFYERKSPYEKCISLKDMLLLTFWKTHFPHSEQHKLNSIHLYCIVGWRQVSANMEK